MKINGQNSIHQNRKQTYLSFGSHKNFRHIKLSEALKSLKESEIPQQVKKYLERMAPDANERLVDVHKAVYKRLLTSKSLKEVKDFFPEFKDVVEMTSLNPKTVHGGFVSEVFNNKVENLSPKDCALKLLKLYYGEAMTWQQVGEQFGTTASAIQHLFNRLGITPLKYYYAKLISQTKTSFDLTRTKLSELAKKRANRFKVPIDHKAAKERLTDAWNYAYEQVPEMKKIKKIPACIKGDYHDRLKESYKDPEIMEVVDRFFNAYRFYLKESSPKKLRKNVKVNQ